MVIARLAANRTLYRAPPLGTDTGPGYPLWYGEPVKLSQAETLGPPDDTVDSTGTAGRGAAGGSSCTAGMICG